MRKKWMTFSLCVSLFLTGASCLTVHAEALAPAKNVELHNTANGIRVTWGNVKDAYVYEVYRNGEKAATLQKQNAWRFVDEKTKNREGEEFTYQIVAKAKQNAFEESTSEEVSILRLSSVSSLKLKNGEGLSIDCSWEEHPEADGYEVAVYAEGLKRAIQIKRTELNEIKLIDIYNTKTYRVQVRPYKAYKGGYCYAGWCKSKKIRAKYVK